MDNVILESVLAFPDSGKIINFSKRIKLSDKSNSSIRAKVFSFSSISKEKSATQESHSPEVQISNSEVSSSIEQHQNDTKVEAVQEESFSSILQKVDLHDCSEFAFQSIPKLDARLIRLTDLMHSRIVEHTLIDNSNELSTIREFSFNEESKDDSTNHFTFVEDVNTSDVVQMKNTIEEAFVSDVDDISTDEKDTNNVKKASYSRAKVQKYKADVSNLPKNMLSDNGLFSSDVSTNDVANISVFDREIPVIVPERKDKFLFNDFDSVLKNSQKVDNSINTIPLPADADADFEALLAKIAQLRQDEQDSFKRKSDAVKGLESSTKELKLVAQKYEASSGTLEELKKKINFQLEEMQSNIQNNIRDVEEIQAMTGQNIEKTQIMKDATYRNESYITQFHNVFPIESTNEINDTTKVYSRIQSKAA